MFPAMFSAAEMDTGRVKTYEMHYVNIAVFMVFLIEIKFLKSATFAH